MALTFPSTPTPGQTYAAPNGITYTWDNALGVWTGSAGGGGGGTVTGVTGTAPIVSSGGAAPAISITPATAVAAGSMSAADKAKLDGAATIVSSVTGTSPVSVTAGTTPVVSIATGAVSTLGAVGLDPNNSTIVDVGGGMIRAQNIYNATGPAKYIGTGAGGVVHQLYNGATLQFYTDTANNMHVLGIPGAGGGYAVDLSGGGTYIMNENLSGVGQLVSTSTALQLSGNNASAIVIFQDGGGVTIAQILTAGGVYQALSDERVKENIEDCTYGLEDVMKLRPVSYRFKDRKDVCCDDKYLGFIAQEVDPVITEAVHEMPQDNGDDYLGLSYQTLIPVLTKAIQELKQEFDEYKASHP